MKLNYEKLMQGLDFSTFVLAKYPGRAITLAEEEQMGVEFIIPN